MTTPLNEDQFADAFGALLNDDLETGGAPEALASEDSPEDAPAVEATPDDVDDAPEVAEGTDDNPEDDTDDDPEDPAAADGQDDAVDLTQFAELADILEVPKEDLLKLHLQFKASGEDFDLPIEEILSGYQIAADSTKKLQQAAELKRQHLANEQARVAEFEATHQQLAQQIQAIAQFKMSELETPEMRALQHSDPARYIVEKDRVHSQVQAIDQVARENAQAIHASRQKQMEQYTSRETERLHAAVPDWGEEHAKLTFDTFIEYGFSQEETVGQRDHRALRIVHDLARANAKVAKLEAEAAARATDAAKATAKAKRVPPTRVRPKAKDAASVTVRKRHAARVKRLKKTGDPQDAVGLFADLM